MLDSAGRLLHSLASRKEKQYNFIRLIANEAFNGLLAQLRYKWFVGGIKAAIFMILATRASAFVTVEPKQNQTE